MTVGLLQLLLVEASAKEIEASIRKKFPGRDSDIDAVVTSDNPPALWPVIVKFIVQSNEPANQVLSLVGAFNRSKQKLQKKDLSQYKSVQELQQAIESLAPSRANIKGQVEKIYEDENFIVVYPHSKEASCVWGKGTTWCTARTQSTNYFPYYANNGNKLYYLITKGVDPQVDPNAKMSIGFDASGQFSGGRDGGLSVDANNNGITMKDVAEQLGTRADAKTKLKIINAIETHAASSDDHPMKGFYEKATQDPAAHRAIFDDAFNGVSPEPYISLLVMAPETEFYSLFYFDMCVYLNELLKKFGIANEAFSELATSPNLYVNYGWGWEFPGEIEQGMLARYISDALWLIDLDDSRLSQILKAPLITNVNSINAAMRMIESGMLNERQLSKIYLAHFLDRKKFHQFVRDQAVNTKLSDEARAPYMQLLELHSGQPSNLEAWTEAVLFADKTGAINNQLSAWIYHMENMAAVNGSVELSAAMFTKVIREFIIPNLGALIDSQNRAFAPERLMELLIHFKFNLGELIAVFNPLTDLFFLLKNRTNPDSKVMYSASDHLILAGIVNASLTDPGRLRALIDLTPGFKRPDYRISDIIDYVAEAIDKNPDTALFPVMRQVADIARETNNKNYSNELPSFAVKWWNSSALPPEYVPIAKSIRQNTLPGQNVRWPWPPPAPQQMQTLAELLFVK